MKIGEIIAKVNECIESYDDARIYFTLRTMHIRQISEQQIHMIKIFLALRTFGLQVISTHMILSFYSKSRGSALAILHGMGDKGILTLITNEKSGPLRYVLSPKFLEFYAGQNE